MGFQVAFESENVFAQSNISRERVTVGWSSNRKARRASSLCMRGTFNVPVMSVCREVPKRFARSHVADTIHRQSAERDWLAWCRCLRSRMTDRCHMLPSSSLEPRHAVRPSRRVDHAMSSRFARDESSFLIRSRHAVTLEIFMFPRRHIYR